MTNEEIDKALATLPRFVCGFDGDEQVDGGPLVEFEKVSSLVRSLVSQVYEEAAREVLKLECLPLGDYNEGYVAGIQEAATAVRALKDSLSPEPVSS